ncbi:MAG: flagellar biosynthesis regulator FlaF [Alphaproteobacteria bacterium]|jgi:flagellar biosynthesis regulator FlaF
MNQMLATRRYGTIQQTRSLREQEADVFRRVNYGLKAALNGDAIERARAVADNRRLWMALEAAMTHPANQLPEALKGSILSLGRLIQREMQVKSPDILFLINMNDQMIAGLSGDPG